VYPLKISLRYLLKKRVTLICIAGVMVGVMALTVVLSVMNGFLRDIRRHIRGTLSDLVVQSVDGYYGLKDYESVIKQLQEIPHVAACAPYLEGVAVSKCYNVRQTVTFRGVVPHLQEQVSEWRGHPGKGRTRLLPGRTIETVLKDTPNGLPTMFGGQELFRSSPKGTSRDAQEDPDYNFVPLGMTRVVLVTPTKEFSAGVRVFRLTGLFKTGMYEFDRSYVYISLERAQQLVNAKGAVSGISVRLDDYAHASEVVKAIRDKLGRNYQTETWEEKRATFLLAVEVERRVMAIILFFILIVAGFSIFAILTMVVMEKAKDIGTLKAIGATRKGVMSIFMLLGTVIGGIGSALGLGAGLTILKTMNDLEDLIYQRFGWRVFPQDIYYLDHIPHQISVPALSFIVIGAVLTSFLASLYPAWRAARLDPVQTLRYE